MEQFPYFVVIGLGAVCLALGFFIIVRGIGAAESGGTFKFLGFEMTTSKVGPGILFSMFGVFLIVVALIKMPNAQVNTAGAASPSQVSGNTPAPSTKAGAINSNPDTENQVTPAANQPPAPLTDERKSAIVSEALTKSAEGLCPDDLMAQPVLAACRSQQPSLSQQLSSAGAIRSVSHIGRNGYNEVFNVTYDNSVATWWAIFNTDGKLITFLPAQ